MIRNAKIAPSKQMRIGPCNELGLRETSGMNAAYLYLASLGVCLSLTGCLERVEVWEPFEAGDLSEWDYDPAIWTMENRVVIGKTKDEAPLPYNQFLICDSLAPNFELTCEMKVIGENNSGIQYRSKRRDDLGDYVVSGYQCDVHPTNKYCAMAYEEKGRGIIATRGQKVVIMPNGEKRLIGEVGTPAEVNLADWNTITVRAEGNRMTHKLNGIVTAEVIDLQEDGAFDGWSPGLSSASWPGDGSSDSQSKGYRVAKR